MRSCSSPILAWAFLIIAAAFPLQTFLVHLFPLLRHSTSLLRSSIPQLRYALLILSEAAHCDSLPLPLIPFLFLGSPIPIHRSVPRCIAFPMLLGSVPLLFYQCVSLAYLFFSVATRGISSHCPCVPIHLNSLSMHLPIYSIPCRFCSTERISCACLCSCFPLRCDTSPLLGNSIPLHFCSIPTQSPTILCQRNTILCLCFSARCNSPAMPISSLLMR